MVILDTVNKSLVAVLAGAVSANQPIFTVAYADTDGTTFTEGSNDGTLNNATPVTLVAAPASGHRRIIKSISIYNADTASVTYSLYLLNTAAVQIIEKRILTTLTSKLYGFEALDPFNQGLNTGDSPTFAAITDTGLTASEPVVTGGSKNLSSVSYPTFKGSLSLAQADISGLANMPGRNIVINGGFTINQRVYVSAATLAAAAYGHDRWKAGAAGGDYSFTQLASPTTITIAANKTIIQVVEDKMVYGGTYILSWTGTAQARYAINSSTPAGSYAASPITITGQTAGTTMSVEFGNGASSGTLGQVQLELGSVPTPFELRPYEQELALCQRYCLCVSSGNSSVPFFISSSGGTWIALVRLPVTMRAGPTIVVTNLGTYKNSSGGPGSNQWQLNEPGSGAAITWGTAPTTIGITSQSKDYAPIYCSGTTPSMTTVGLMYLLSQGAGSILEISTEL
jgi:hypothetical protein